MRDLARMIVSDVFYLIGILLATVAAGVCGLADLFVQIGDYIDDEL